jgi:hypothetical protein
MAFCVDLRRDSPGKVNDMRMLLGMILGAALLIGAAYIHDTMASPPSGTTTAVERPLVNWDVVNNSWSYWKVRMQHGWTQLTENVPELPKNIR